MLDLYTDCLISSFGQTTATGLSDMLTCQYSHDAVAGFVTISEINGSGDDCQLQLTLEIHEDFPQDIPEFKRESGVAGWNYFLDRLKIYLEAS